MVGKQHRGALRPEPARRAPEPPPDSGEVLDLIGRGLSPGHGDSPLTPQAAREVLAAVLGLPARSLAAITDDQALNALARVRSLMRRLSEAAAIDELTGAMRRGAGLAAVRREMARARRGDSRLVLAVLDVDGLKRKNDTEGHLAGDALLRMVVSTLREQLREYDLVIRYGGDEFLAVFAAADLSEARRRFRAYAEELATRTGGQSASIGLAALRKQDTVETLISRADAALYSGRRHRPPSPSGGGGAPADPAVQAGTGRRGPSP